MLTRTQDLCIGDTLVVQDTDSRDYVLPISDSHSGREVRVLEVKPFILTAGPKAGQVARTKGAPLYLITTEPSLGVRFSATADQTWTVA